MMQVSIVSIGVSHSKPVDNMNGHFTINYWLTLTVNANGVSGTGQSPITTVVVDRDNGQQAQEAADLIQDEVSKQIKGMDIQEALSAFPDLITSIAKTYEFRPMAGPSASLPS